jgi:hypothetical protein
MRSIGYASSTEARAGSNMCLFPGGCRPGALGLWKVNVQRVPKRGVVDVDLRALHVARQRDLDPPTGTCRGSGGAGGPAISNAPAGGETPRVVVVSPPSLHGAPSAPPLRPVPPVARRARGTAPPMGGLATSAPEGMAGRDYYRPVGSHEIQHLLHEYGCLLVFVAVGLQTFGLPVPGTTALIAAALCSRDPSRDSRCSLRAAARVDKPAARSARTSSADSRAGRTPLSIAPVPAAIGQSRTSWYPVRGGRRQRCIGSAPFPQEFS